MARGCKENTDGLIRQDLLKGIDLSEFSPTDLNQIAISLNTRPSDVSISRHRWKCMRGLSLNLRIHQLLYLGFETSPTLDG